MSTIKCYDTLKCMYVEVEVTEEVYTYIKRSYWREDMQDRRYQARKLLFDDVLDYSVTEIDICDEVVKKIEYTRNILIGAFKVAQGGGNYAPTTPRDVFMRTLLIGAINIVLVHNHPSGDVKPSKGDDNVTNIMKQAADLLGINMLDHVIVGNSFYSYRSDYKL